jgi:SsrA-binding protein
MESMDAVNTVTKNKKAYHEYHILETFEAGIELVGTEVKSIRAGQINLTDSYARVRNNELWLIGAHISPYEQGNIFNHDPLRERKLLMHSREIVKIRRSIEEKGLTLIPVGVYFKHGRAKVELGIGKGKKLYDKREDNATRDAKREMDRARKKAVT